MEKLKFRRKMRILKRSHSAGKCERVWAFSTSYLLQNLKIKKIKRGTLCTWMRFRGIHLVEQTEQKISRIRKF